MEFQDPVVQQEEIQEIQPDKKHDKTSTEENVEKLEEEIDVVYSIVETNLKNLWNKTSEEAKVVNEKYNETKDQLLQQLNKLKISPTVENLKSIETQFSNLNLDNQYLTKLKQNVENLDQIDISGKANNALDLLDSHLEQVENKAINYVKSFGSFWSSVISVEDPKQKIPAKDNETTLFKSSIKYGTSRYDQDLYKLHTESEYYLKDDKIDNFNPDDKTDEISNLLSKYPELNQLMNDLVPIKISYAQFWYHYFNQRLVIEKDEQIRKKLTETHDEAEEFDWDDDEEEGEEEEEEETETGDDTKDDDEKKPNKNLEPSDETDDWE